MRSKTERTTVQMTARAFRLKKRLAHGLAVLSLALYLAFCLSSSFGPTVLENMEYACKGIAADAVSMGIHNALVQDPDLYDGLYELLYAQDGSVQTVTTNTTRLNHVEIRLGDAISEELKRKEKTTVNIPLGSLLGWRFWVGKGQDITFDMSQSGYVLSRVSSSMESTGINQTDFTVSITFTVDMVASLSGYIQTTEVQETICVVQMVLSGETPEFYARG